MWDMNGRVYVTLDPDYINKVSVFVCVGHQRPCLHDTRPVVRGYTAKNQYVSSHGLVSLTLIFHYGIFDPISITNIIVQ